MDVPLPAAVRLLSSALDEIDRKEAFLASDKKRLAERSFRRSFVRLLTPVFFAKYVDMQPSDMQNMLRCCQLFAPRNAAFRRATYGCGDAAYVALVRKLFHQEYPAQPVPHLDEGIRRLASDFAALAVTDEESLLDICAEADAHAADERVEDAHGLYQRLLASKPYVGADITTIGNAGRGQFFLRIKVQDLYCCSLIGRPFEGVRIATQLLGKAAVWHHDLTDAQQDRCWIATSLILVQAAQHLRAELDAEPHQDAHQRALLRVQAQSVFALWQQCCARARECERKPWAAEPPADEGRTRQCLSESYLALKQFSLRLAERKDGWRQWEVEPIASLALSLALDPKFVPMAPAKYELASFAPYPVEVDRIARCLQRASSGEEVSMRNFLFYGEPGEGKSHLVRALCQRVVTASAKKGPGWSMPVRVFELLDEVAMSSVFDGSREKIDSYFRDLVRVADQLGFVPVVILEEVDKFLSRRNDQKENDKIYYAFLSKMDSVQKENKVFFLCTTNCPEELAPAARSRFGGQEIAYRASEGPRSKVLFGSNLFDAEQVRPVLLSHLLCEEKKSRLLEEGGRSLFYVVMGLSHFFSMREMNVKVQKVKDDAESRGCSDVVVQQMKLKSLMIADLFGRTSKWAQQSLFCSARQLYEKGAPRNCGLTASPIIAHHAQATVPAEEFWDRLRQLEQEPTMPFLPLFCFSANGVDAAILMDRKKFRRVYVKSDMAGTPSLTTEHADVLGWVRFCANGARPNAQTVAFDTMFWSPMSSLCFASTCEAKHTIESSEELYFQRYRHTPLSFLEFHLAVIKKRSSR